MKKKGKNSTNNFGSFSREETIPRGIRRAIEAITFAEKWMAENRVPTDSPLGFVVQRGLSKLKNEVAYFSKKSGIKLD